MAQYLVKRVLGALPVFFGITLLVFFLMNMAPATIADLAGGEDASSAAARAALEANLGLDQPLPVRYVLWLKELLTGDLGLSYRTGQPVLGMIAQRVGPSLILTGTGVAAAVQAGGTGLSSANILVVLYLGLVGSGLAQYTWTASLAELPASTCSLFYPLQPMFSALLGMLLLNETFTPSFLVGLVLISADVILSTLETRKLAKQAQAGSDR